MRSLISLGSLDARLVRQLLLLVFSNHQVCICDQLSQEALQTSLLSEWLFRYHNSLGISRRQEVHRSDSVFICYYFLAGEF